MEALEKSKNNLIKLLIDENDRLSKLVYSETKINKFIKVNPETFRHRRKALKIPMKEVCDYIGITESTMSNVENGKDAYFSSVMAMNDYITMKESEL